MKLLKAIFILAVSVFLAGVLGYGYFYIQSQESQLREREKQIGELKKSQIALKEEMEKFEIRQKDVVDKNKTLRDEVKTFGEQKSTILNQVRTSVAGFESFRQSATDEIAKLKASVSSLEAEKKDVEDKLSSVEESSVSEKEKLTSDIHGLNKKIVKLKSTEEKLVENLNSTDKVAMTAETAKLHYNLGNFYFRNAEYAAAAAEYKKALFYNPNDADANYNLAIVSDNFLDDRPTAMYRYRRYLDLRPSATDKRSVQQRILDLQLREEVIYDPVKKKDPHIFKTDAKDIPELNMIGDK